ncbi:hypothetical protein F511_04257 [Dorcoceras hygrometricum]|nr:hypothetical protein F511_04257 [Dorcoceras hygrometricum]
MAGASTCSDQFSLVRQQFEPRLVSLEPPRPGGGPEGRALVVVAGAWRKIVKTGRCSLAPLDFRAYGSSSNIGVKWHFSGGVTYRDPEVSTSACLYAILLVWTLLCITIEHAEPLGSLGLNGAGDDPVDEYIPTGEHAEPLGSLGLNGAGDDPVDEYIPTGGEDL